MEMVENAFLINLQLVLWFAFYWSVKRKLFFDKNEWNWLKVHFWLISSWNCGSYSIGLLRAKLFCEKNEWNWLEVYLW